MYLSHTHIVDRKSIAEDIQVLDLICTMILPGSPRIKTGSFNFSKIVGLALFLHTVCNSDLQVLTSSHPSSYRKLPGM